MYQKDLIRKVWESAGLYEESDSKLKQFLAMLDDPTLCWHELTDLCRRNYAEYKVRLVRPILQSEDTLVHLMVIRMAAAAHHDEMTLLEQYIAASDPVRHEVELKAVAHKNIPRLHRALRKKPDLTAEVRGIIATQGAAATPRQAAVAAAASPAEPTTR